MDYYATEIEALGFLLPWWVFLLDDRVNLQNWYGVRSNYHGCPNSCFATSHWLHGQVHEQLPAAERDWSAMEISHLILHLHPQEGTHTIITVEDNQSGYPVFGQTMVSEILEDSALKHTLHSRLI